MCTTCGCGSDETRVTSMVEPTGSAEHDHGPHDQHSQHGPHADGQHDHVHALHSPDGPRTHTIDIEQAVLAKNDDLADHNRAWFAERGITAVNLMSSPGAGKTALIERTIRDNGADRTISVVEGDQESVVDAVRIRDAGAKAVQINTGAGCHLDARMVRSGLEVLDPGNGDLVFLENVGNLVCPALFDLGEAKKVVVISVTEGEHKPLKYPQMFAAADLVVVNKIDLLPYVDFDVDRCEKDARSVNPNLVWMPMSVRSGDNVDAWYDWLRGL